MTLQEYLERDPELIFRPKLAHWLLFGVSCIFWVLAILLMWDIFQTLTHVLGKNA